MFFLSQTELLITTGSKPSAESLFPLVKKMNKGIKDETFSALLTEVALKKERASKNLGVKR